MTVQEIAKLYDINPFRFERYLKSIGVGKQGLLAYALNDDIEKHVNGFKEMVNKEQEEERQKENARLEEERKRQEEEDDKNRALASMLITSGFSFDGYKVVKYSGYISGDDAVEIKKYKRFLEGGGVVHLGDVLCDELVKIRRNAIAELKEAAYNLGCNAVIGVDFDYLTMDQQLTGTIGSGDLPYVICVTANGNAVVIEKE